MAAIRHSLQKEVFGPNDERLIGVANVAKASKKKKTAFLCAAVTTERPIRVSICKVKKSEKDNYKKKTSWFLSDLTIVDGKDEFKDTAEFDLYFERVYKWVASNVSEKYIFITCLWNLCCHHLPRQKPIFVNIPKHLLEEAVSINETGTPTHQLGEAAIMETEDYQALSPCEEADLERLMTQYNFVICNAEAFTEQLAKELGSLDETNVHTIIASEQRVQQLMSMLQTAIDEVTKLEGYLDKYDSLLQNVKDSVLRMEEKKSLIHIQNVNNYKLMEELENFILQLNLSHEHRVTLLSGDLKTAEGIVECISAAKALQEAMNAQIHSSLLRMSAYQEKRKLFEKLRSKFTLRLSHYLNNLFLHLGNDFGDSLGLFSTDMTLPKHATCHQELMPYMELMTWLKSTDNTSYIQLSKVYTSSLNKLYDKEIKSLFEHAKEKDCSKGAFEKDKKGRMSGSSQDIGVKSTAKPRAFSLLGMDPEQYGSDLESIEWETFDKLFEMLLSALEPVCLAEQQFCIQFFGLISEASSSSNQHTPLQSDLLSPTPSNLSLSRTSSEEVLAVTQRKGKLINEEARKMMAELFSCLESELLNFIAYYDKIDGFYSMYVLVRLSQHVMSAQDTGSFLSMTFATVLVQAKRNFDKYMQSQIKSIEEAKVSKKSKCGILPFVSNFESFAQQAEGIFKESDRHTDLDKWYVKLIHAMFDAIVHIASDHQKTPHEVVLMENFHHLYTLLYQLKISCLETERKDAKQKYNEALQAYVTHYFGRPLDKLNIFFEGVQSKVQHGVKESEMSYQLDFNKQELRKVLKEYPGKEVKKGLESLYKKVEKHLCEEENLLQVVWHSMQDEFIRQYKYIESLIERCYPGSKTTFEFTIEDILKFFSDIAQSH